MAPEAWRTTAQSVVLEDRWIRLRADDCVDGVGRAQDLDAGEIIDVRVVPITDLGQQLAQSYHQLTWFRACARLSG